LLLITKLAAFTQAITQITSLSSMKMKSSSGIAAVEQVTAAARSAPHSVTPVAFRKHPLVRGKSLLLKLYVLGYSCNRHAFVSAQSVRLSSSVSWPDRDLQII
jgi:hypothetical protein